MDKISDENATKMLGFGISAPVVDRLVAISIRIFDNLRVNVLPVHRKRSQFGNSNSKATLKETKLEEDQRKRDDRKKRQTSTYLCIFEQSWLVIFASNLEIDHVRSREDRTKKALGAKDRLAVETNTTTINIEIVEDGGLVGLMSSRT